MKYTKTQENSEVTVQFTANAEEWQSAIEHAYQEIKGKFSVPGFRKGKVPKSVIVRQYGEGVFFDDAFEHVFGVAYDEFLSKEKNLIPVAQPKVDIGELTEKGITFSAVVTISPDVTLGEYKGMKVKRSAVQASDEEIDGEILRIRERAARKLPVTDRAAANGDVVNIDFIGAIGDKAFEGGSAESQELKLGSGSFIAGFEEQVVGMKLGESRDIKATFPKDYMATDLAGKEATFKVKLNSIHTLDVSAADDVFAKDVSKFETFAEYRNDIAARMQRAADEQNKRNDEDAVLDALEAITTVTVPQIMIERQIDVFMRDLEYRLAQQGMKKEDYFKYADTTAEKMRASRKDDAVKAVRLRLAVEKVIEVEKIKVTEKEYSDRVNAIAESQHVAPAKFAAEHSQQLQMMFNEMLMDKAVAKLIDWSEWSGDAAKPASAKPAAKKTSTKTATTAEKSTEKSQ